MERPSNIRAAAADEARDMNFEIARLGSKLKNKSRTHNIASRETNDSSIFSKIAKRNLRSKEVTKMMFSCPDGITADSVPKLQGYTNTLVAKGENPYSDTSSFLPKINSNLDGDNRSRKI